MIFKFIILIIMILGYLSMAIWAIFTAFKLPITTWLKIGIIFFAAVFPPIGFVLAMYTKLNSRGRQEPSNNHKSDKKKSEDKKQNEGNQDDKRA